MKIVKRGEQREEVKHWPVDGTLLACPRCACQFTLDESDVKGDGAFRVFRSRMIGSRAMLRGICPDCFKDIEIMEPRASETVQPVAQVKVNAKANKQTLRIQ